MSKEQILWLARDENGEDCTLFVKRPRKSEASGGWWTCPTGKFLACFCYGMWKKLCPALALEPGEGIKVKLTQTKTGIRLERIT